MCSPLLARYTACIAMSFSFVCTWLQKASQLVPSPMGTATLRLGLASLTETNTRREASCGLERAHKLALRAEAVGGSRWRCIRSASLCVTAAHHVCRRHSQPTAAHRCRLRVESRNLRAGPARTIHLKRAGLGNPHKRRSPPPRYRSRSERQQGFAVGNGRSWGLLLMHRACKRGERTIFAEHRTSCSAVLLWRNCEIGQSLPCLPQPATLQGTQNKQRCGERLPSWRSACPRCWTHRNPPPPRLACSGAAPSHRAAPGRLPSTPKRRCTTGKLNDRGEGWQGGRAMTRWGDSQPRWERVGRPDKPLISPGKPLDLQAASADHPGQPRAYSGA